MGGCSPNLSLPSRPRLEQRTTMGLGMIDQHVRSASLDEHVTVLATQSDSVSGITLSVIVPAYREGHRIYNNLLRLLRELDSLHTSYEVVVVSDGNTDATAAEARRVGSPGV